MIKNLFFAAITFLLTAHTIFAQSDAIKYAKEITEENLLKQLKIIASADMEGRETGTRGQRLAASYIESQFKEFGLKPAEKIVGYQQFYPLHTDSLTPGIFKIGDMNLEYGSDYLIQAGSTARTYIKASDIVFAGYGIDDDNYNDYKGKKVKGKIVIVLSGEPKSGERYSVSGTTKPSRWGFNTAMKAEAALKHGAAGMFIINPAWSVIPGSFAKATLKTPVFYPRPSERPAVITISRPFLGKIFGEQTADEILKMQGEKAPLNKVTAAKKLNTELSFTKTTTVIGATNVIGYIEGTDKKDEYLYLSAHYDHLGKKGEVIYYGADDDGSGTVAIMEIARAFSQAKKEGNGPRRTVVFLAVSGEEKGLWGSEYYTDHPAFPLDKTTADLNIDMIGRIDPNRKHGDSTNYVYIVGDDKLSSELKPISIAANQKLTNLELDYKFNEPDDPERIYFRSDHYNFARKGVPIIFYFDGIHADYHKPSDTWDKINYDLLEKRARLVFMTAWEMANRDAMLKRDIPLDEQTR